MKKEQQELRIRPLPPPPEKRRVSFRLPEPTLSEFEAYLAAFQEIYGVEPDRDFVADQIFNAFFESDRAFAAYQARGNSAEAKKRMVRPETKAGGEVNHIATGYHTITNS